MKQIIEHEENLIAAGQEYRCRFQSHPNGGYFVTCAELPPMLAFGEALLEARRNVIEEIEGWVEVLEEQGHNGFRNGCRGR